MSKAGKILFAAALVSFLVLIAFRLVYGGWHDAFWLPLGMTVAFFLGGVAKDHRAIRELLFLRTTKHGMNMGVLIAVMIALLACVNVLAYRYEKKFDWTSERLFSLSDQSRQAVDGLKAPVELVLLVREENQGGERVTKAVRDLVDLYRNVSEKVTFTSYDILRRPDLAQKYDFSAGPYAFYAVQGEKRVKIDPPTEEGVTRALIKMGRDRRKTIYFTRGHGESLLEGSEPAGLSTIKDELSVTYDVKPLALFETQNKVPEDAAALAIVGPKQQFLDVELDAVREYARRGGRILIAADPGMRHNMALLTKTFGVEFVNDYVFDGRAQALQRAPSLILGTDFPTGAAGGEITKAFSNPDSGAIALFELASSLRKAPGADITLVVDELVRTAPSTGSVPELREQMEILPNGPHTIAMAVRGKLAKDANGKDPGAKDFQAVIFSDSDFVTNRLIMNNLNRDLASNSFAWLTDDKELISIRPKEPKGTKLDMMTGTYWGLMLALLVVPVALYLSSVVVWWRRRAA